MPSPIELLSSDILHILGHKRRKIYFVQRLKLLRGVQEICVCISVYISVQIGLSVTLTKTSILRVFEIRGAGECFWDQDRNCNTEYLIFIFNNNIY